MLRPMRFPAPVTSATCPSSDFCGTRDSSKMQTHTLALAGPRGTLGIYAATTAGRDTSTRLLGGAPSAIMRPLFGEARGDTGSEASIKEHRSAGARSHALGDHTPRRG